MDETELIVRAKTGDRTALNELVARYWQPVYHFASYKLGNAQDAEEVAQETFIRVFRALPDYQITGAVFTAYIKRIAVNLITDFWRKKSRSPAIADIAEVQELAADGQEPDLQLLSSEMRETLLSILQKLPPEQRQAVELRIIAGVPVRETALTMGKIGSGDKNAAAAGVEKFAYAAGRYRNNRTLRREVSQMPETTKTTPEAEFLSQLLDQLNSGRQPECDDSEMAELLAIASMLKQSSTDARPPQAILDKTVDKIIDAQSTPPGKAKSRFWLWRHPGILGAAASILLVVGLQLYPSWNSSEVQTVSAPPVVTEEKPSKLAVRQSVPASTPPSHSSDNAGTVPASAAPPQFEPIKKAPVLREQTPPVKEQASIMGEQQAVAAMKTGNGYKAAAFAADDFSERWPLPLLSIPGQVPNEISTDKKTGAVRQVFWRGTPQEVRVIQRMLKQEEKLEKPVLSAPEETAKKFNSVTVVLYNQEVTVEGSRPETELMSIARQLTMP